MRKSLIIPLTLLLAACAPCTALQWSVEPVHALGQAQGDCTLLFSGSSAPRVVYSANSQVVLATRVGYSWSTETVAACGSWGGWSSAAVDSTGSVGVGYVLDSGSSTTVRFATRVSGAWTNEYIATIGWLADYVSLAFDSTNSAWMAFCDGQMSPSIRAAKRTAPDRLSVEPVSTVGDVTGPSIAIGPSNTPHISFVESATGTVKLARRNPSDGWSIETVDGSLSSPAAWYTSLAFDPQGRPAVAYFADAASGSIRLKFAVKTSSGWQKENVVTLTAESAQHCSLRFSPDGKPWIAYFNSTASNLACAWKTPGGWLHETVDSSTKAGQRPSMRLDAVGNPCIGYVNSFAHDVYFSSATLPKTAAEIKALPDGVTVRLESVVTTTRADSVGSDFADRHYIESPDRSIGIMAYYGELPDIVERGTEVYVTGVTGTIDGERAIVSPVIVPVSPIDEIRPLGLTNRSLGGGDFHYIIGPPASGQKGVLGGTGLNNIGLLVRTCGHVVAVDSTTPPAWFKIDDGSGVVLKCLIPPGVTPPSGYVAVTGINSCEQDGSGNLSRLIRIRDTGDIHPPQSPLAKGGR